MKSGKQHRTRGHNRIHQITGAGKSLRNLGTASRHENAPELGSEQSHNGSPRAHKTFKSAREREGLPVARARIFTHTHDGPFHRVEHFTVLFYFCTVIRRDEIFLLRGQILQLARRRQASQRGTRYWPIIIWGLVVAGKLAYIAHIFNATLYI